MNVRCALFLHVIFIVVALVGSVGASETAASVTTDHFELRSVGGASLSADLGARCEQLLAELRGKWFGTRAALQWRPKCLLVVHGEAETYLRDVPGGERTVGSSWIVRERGRIVTRRIDVRGDKADWFESALPHELIHVVFSDVYADTTALRWAEEGMSVLSDSWSKQIGHHEDFRRAAMRGGHFRLVELMSLGEYPAAHRLTTFYGQSAALVRYLVQRGGEAEFTAFLCRAADDGYDAALRRCYRIDGVAELERHLEASVASPAFASAR